MEQAEAPARSEFPSRPLRQGRTAESASPLGVPVGLFGLCLFTFGIVTYYFLPAAKIGAGIGLAGLLLQLGSVRISSPVWCYALFILWAFLASFTSQYQAIAIDEILEHLKMLTVVLILVNSVRTRRHLRFYLLFFLGCFMLFPVRGTIIGGDDVAGRAVWNYIYSNPNDLAALSLLTLGIALGFAFSRQTHALVRLGAGASAVLLLAVMLKTQSRGAFIGLVVGMGPALVWHAIKRPFRLLIVITSAALIIGPQIPPRVWERLAGIGKLTSESTIADADAEGSAAQRYAIQQVALQIFRADPVFGVGLGAYPFENDRYAPDLGMKDPHSTYLSLLTEVGAPGCLLWGALVWSAARFAYRMRKASADPLGAQQAWLEHALWAYLVAALFGSFAGVTFLYLILGLLWCSGSLLRRSLPPSPSSQ